MDEMRHTFCGKAGVPIGLGKLPRSKTFHGMKRLVVIRVKEPAVGAGEEDRLSNGDRAEM